MARPLATARGSVALFPEAAPDQVRHLDEEEATVAPEARLQMAGERVDAVAVHVVVVADVEGGAGVRRPPQEELRADVRAERRVVGAGARKQEARELVGAAQREDVVVKRRQSGVVAGQAIL